MKQSFIKTSLIAAFVLTVGINLNAQEKKAPATPGSTGQTPKTPVTSPSAAQAKRAPMTYQTNAMSKVPVPVQNLMKFMGRWVGDVTLVIEGKTHEVQYRLVGRGTSGGYGIYLDESFSDSTLGDMKGSNLVGFDPNDSKIHWYSVDNQGTTHEHIGNWNSPDSLYMEYNGVRKGKSYKEKINLSFKGREELHFSLLATLDGKESEKMNGVFQREKPPVRPKTNPGQEKEKKE